ncbi:hypothetical protein RND81_08G014400 [Saponaria officinalis]|uniref:Domain X domain-containing protein n=1 Tax=Saponaria officinalis TaxID=3572 RepID=A0AAW1J488_SAPOF
MSLRNFIKHLPCNTSFILHTTNLHKFSTISSIPQIQPHNPQNPNNQNPHKLLKDDPIQICSDIWVKSFTIPKTNPILHLTGFLSKFDLWVLAYQRVVAQLTGSFPSRNGIHFHVLDDLLSLRNAVIKGRFNWDMRSQLYIRGPNEKPVDEFTPRKTIKRLSETNVVLFQDKVVQEVLFFVLEPVLESRFSSKSHAFRPGRNAHTVIRTIRSNFAGFYWYLRGDLSEALEKVDTSLVMNCMQKFVKDNRVLGLIKSALHEPRNPRNRQSECSDVSRISRGKKYKKKKKKGEKRKVLDPNVAKPDPYWLRTFFSFAPEEAEMVPNYGHCGILSPLLANVCLNELDHMMEDKIVEFFKPCLSDTLSKNVIDNGSHNPAWPEFVPSEEKDKTRKMDYIRYGGHFLIGIRGSRVEAVEMRKVLIEFCRSKMGIELDNSKVEIEHVSRGIQFLDHVISHRIIYPTLHYTATGGRTVSKKGVGTLLSVTASLPQCIRRFRRMELLKGDKDPEPLPCTPMLYSSQAHTNSQMNKFLETMADWYKYADNRKKVVGFCAYVIRSSLAKLYASRYKLKSRAKVYGIAARDLRHSLRGRGRGRGNNVGSEYSDLVRLGVADPIEGVQFSHMSLIPSCDYTPFPRVWIPEHEQVFREYIKLQDPKYFCDLLETIKDHGLVTPQNEMSEIVSDFKTLGVRRFGIDPKRHP